MSTKTVWKGSVALICWSESGKGQSFRFGGKCCVLAPPFPCLTTDLFLSARQERLEARNKKKFLQKLKQIDAQLAERRKEADSKIREVGGW